jgi:hypothetical protein
MIELKLFQNLDERSQLEATKMYTGDTEKSDFDEFGGEKVTITGVRDGVVVSVYVFLGFLSSKEGIVNREWAYLISEPREQGVGSETIERVGRIFQSVAFYTNTTFMHRMMTEHSNLATRQGYTYEGKGSAGDIYRKQFAPIKHELPSSEQRIVDAIINSIKPSELTT